MVWGFFQSPQSGLQTATHPCCWWWHPARTNPDPNGNIDQRVHTGGMSYTRRERVGREQAWVGRPCGKIYTIATETSVETRTYSYVLLLFSVQYSILSPNLPSFDSVCLSFISCIYFFVLSSRPASLIISYLSQGLSCRLLWFQFYRVLIFVGGFPFWSRQKKIEGISGLSGRGICLTSLCVSLFNGHGHFF